MFQYAYDRPGYEDLKVVFNSMIVAEANRESGEDVLVEGLHDLSSPSDDFPKFHGQETTSEDYELAKRIQQWTDQQKPPIRGVRVEKIPLVTSDGDDGDDEDVEFAPPDADSSEIEKEDLHINATHSVGAKSLVGQNILSKSVLLTQDSQASAAKSLAQSTERMEQLAVNEVRSILKLVGKDQILYEEVMKTLTDLHLKIMHSKNMGVRVSNSDKDGEIPGGDDNEIIGDRDGSDSIDDDALGEGFTFPDTGHSKASKKRKKGAAL
jgi:hypothetical protein